MRDAECVEFLQWALPRLRLRWPGFRKVRRQVCRRIERRRRTLGLGGIDAYKTYLEANSEEWARLDELCHVTVSRFHRDRGVFDFLGRTVLPALAREAEERSTALEAWSAGCASGEEAYTLALVWQLRVARDFPRLALHVLCTDVDETVLRRARRAEYPESCLRDVPSEWRRAAFVVRDGLYRLRPELGRPVRFRRHDLRDVPPGGPFDLVLCRNVAFTYFDLELQREVALRLAGCLRPSGALVLGAHETLPEGSNTLLPWAESLRVYRARVEHRGESEPMGREDEQIEEALRREEEHRQRMQEVESEAEDTLEHAEQELEEADEEAERRKDRIDDVSP